MLVDSRSLATLLLIRDIQTHRHIESRPELSRAVHARSRLLSRLFRLRGALAPAPVAAKRPLLHSLRLKTRAP